MVATLPHRSPTPFLLLNCYYLSWRSIQMKLLMNDYYIYPAGDYNGSIWDTWVTWDTSSGVELREPPASGISLLSDTLQDPMVTHRYYIF